MGYGAEIQLYFYYGQVWHSLESGRQGTLERLGAVAGSGGGPAHVFFALHLKQQHAVLFIAAESV